MILEYGYLAFLLSIPLSAALAPLSLAGIVIYGYTGYLQLEIFFNGSRNILHLLPYIFVSTAMGLLTLCAKNVLLYHRMISIEMTLKEFIIEMRETHDAHYSRR
jgi:hypothetical protein